MRPNEPRSFASSALTPETPSNVAQSLLLEDAQQPGLANWRQCFPEIIGRSVVMQRVLETVFKVSRTDSAVLILGESGTGKELIAAALHRLSPRAARPYVALNCSAIPENLLESELFGHEKGAFTSADRRKLGKFQYAEGGTIFLDEIGDMAPLLQAKLLRVLQDKKFALLGGNDLQEVDVRVIAATNINLEQAIKAGRFRQDLFYRLNVLPVVLPPLRERGEDILALLDHFVEAASRLHGYHCYFTGQAIRRLCAYGWPGNVRQLQNLVERLVVMRGGGAIDEGDLPQELLRQSFEDNTPEPSEPLAAKPAMRSKSSLTLPRAGQSEATIPHSFGQLPESGIDLTRFIEDLENSLIRQALERTGNNRNQAARLLGLNRTTLVERIKKRRLADLNEPSKEL